jgi:hypothetical protein
MRKKNERYALSELNQRINHAPPPFSTSSAEVLRSQSSHSASYTKVVNSIATTILKTRRPYLIGSLIDKNAIPMHVKLIKSGRIKLEKHVSKK